MIVGPVGAAVVTVACILLMFVFLGLFCLILWTTDASVGVPSSEVHSLLASILAALMGALIRFVIKVFEPFRKNENLTWFAVGEGFLFLGVGAMLGVLVWALAASGLELGVQALGVLKFKNTLPGVAVPALICGLASEAIIRALESSVYGSNRLTDDGNMKGNIRRPHMPDNQTKV